MRSIFMGTPHYTIPVLEALLSLDGQVVGVYVPPDKPRGRSQATVSSPVKSFAIEHNIEVFQPVSLRRTNVQEDLASLRPDVVVVAAYGKLLPPEVLRIPLHGCVNIHPSLLPKYRGPSPVATAILEGEKRTGVTVMLMDEGMDTGPVLASRPVDIEVDATTERLTPLLFQFGAQLLVETLPLWLGKEINPQPQDGNLAKVTKRLAKVDGEAGWEMSAEDLERRLRAFTPWPGLFTYWKGRSLKILLARTSFNTESGGAAVLGGNRPGEVVSLEEAGVAVGVVTSQGVLGIETLQLEGKRPASSEEFLRGYRDFIGSVLPS